jgi:hypothetical protein
MILVFFVVSRWCGAVLVGYCPYVDLILKSLFKSAFYEFSCALLREADNSGASSFNECNISVGSRIFTWLNTFLGKIFQLQLGFTELTGTTKSTKFFSKAGDKSSGLLQPWIRNW